MGVMKRFTREERGGIRELNQALNDYFFGGDMGSKGKKKKLNDDEIQDEQDVKEMEEAHSKLSDELDGEEIKGRPVPKQAVNFSNEWIKENVTDKKIADLLKSKREADAVGDKSTARKIRRALREAGFYVSKNRDGDD